jgi:hypothetical protein
MCTHTLARLRTHKSNLILVLEQSGFCSAETKLKQAANY